MVIPSYSLLLPALMQASWIRKWLQLKIRLYPTFYSRSASWSGLPCGCMIINACTRSGSSWDHCFQKVARFMPDRCDYISIASWKRTVFQVFDLVLWTCYRNVGGGGKRDYFVSGLTTIYSLTFLIYTKPGKDGSSLLCIKFKHRIVSDKMASGKTEVTTTLSNWRWWWCTQGKVKAL